MCLLIALHHVHPDGPLLVAANRDELYARPSEPMAVLRPADPRVIGGRDRIAGGTWLAVNEHGVVAGLANVPAAGGRDSEKRSRGELPIILARHRSASEAVAALLNSSRPEEYNPAVLLVGDRASLFYVEWTGAGQARISRLPPGLHVLENRPLGGRSLKADSIRRALAEAPRLRGDALRALLMDVLKMHCVHAGSFGTRESEIVLVPARGRPQVWNTGGPPCRAPLVELAQPWDTGVLLGSR